MTDTLNQAQVDAHSGLTYRIRPGARAQDAQHAAPCLILLHGVGSNEQGLIELARQMDPRLTVVLARGPLELGPGQFAWFRVNFTPDGPSINPVQAEQARQTLLRLIEQLPQLHGVDPARIWIAGFSQGGIMSASVALSAPYAVAGFGILSGRILPEVLPLVTAGPALSRLRAFVSHGVQDNVLGIHFAHHAQQVLDQYAVPLEYHEYQGGHALSQPMVADFQHWLATQL